MVFHLNSATGSKTVFAVVSFKLMWNIVLAKLFHWHLLQPAYKIHSATKKSCNPLAPGVH